MSKTEKNNSSLLLHFCCGPCATYPLSALATAYNLQGYFTNFNIHPYREFKKRLIEAQKTAKHYQVPLIVADNYPLIDFIKGALSAENRCLFCYQVRLSQVAAKAAELNIPYFSTTLSISPYQKLDLIEFAGVQAQKKWGVEFKFFDFRPFFAQSRSLARTLKLYQQGYCGCIFSEKERYYRGE